jgi:polyhydroxyalkanoate synthesis regulator phasin
MATSKTSKTSKQTQASVLQIGELRARVDQLRRDVEDAVESIGKRAVDSLPPSGRKQVDDVLGRINSVRGDVNKAVDAWRSDLEHRFKVVRGTVDKRVSTIRKRTESGSKKLVGGVEKRTRKYTERFFKQLRLPVRGDVDALKRRLTQLERRIEDLEKSAKSSRKAAAA